MAEPQGVPAALLERYRELNCALCKQLDGITSESVHMESIRQTLRQWLAVAKDPSLPPGVHYLLDPDSENFPTNPGEMTRTGFVMTSLREIARHADIEIFFSVLDFRRPGDDARLARMVDRQSNDIHEYFVSDKQELLQRYKEASKVEDHVGTLVPPGQTYAVSTYALHDGCAQFHRSPATPASTISSPVASKTPTNVKQLCGSILPTSKVLDKKDANPGQTEDDKERLRENMMCYLTDRVLDKADVAKANAVLQSYSWRPAEPSQCDLNKLQWPRRALEKHLLNAMTVATRAAAISYEPPPNFTDYFADEVIHFPPRILEGEDTGLIRGLNILLAKVDFPDLPAVLSYLPPLVHEEHDRHDPAYVGRWLRRVFVHSRCGPAVYLRMEYATPIVDMCASFLSDRIDLRDV